MSVLFATGSKPVNYPFKHDPNEKKYYGFAWKPNPWIASTEYVLDDIVIPTTPNGYYYKCVNPGRSSAIEPVFESTINSETLDNTVIWKAISYNLMIRSGDAISNSSWIADSTTTIDNQTYVNGITWVRVTGVANTAESFTLTNRVEITRNDGKVEEYDRTLIVSILNL